MSITDRLDTKRLATFWKFVKERQDIYWRRSEGDQRPWTKDPILDKHFFCNVYRELDKGTQYVLNVLFASGASTSMPDLLFRVLLYRMFNVPQTYEFMKPCFSRNGFFNGYRAADILDRKHEVGITIFRGAWMTSGANVVGSKARAYCLEMADVNKKRDKLWKDFRSAGSMENAWKVICEIRWFGGFSAYQVVLDMSYLVGVRGLWSDYDTWVYPGPGARMGLMWLCGKSPAKRKGAGSKKFLPDKECCELIYHLRDSQDLYFHGLGLKFQRWKDKPLDLHNIEFSLCEFNKYMRAQHGGKKRKFLPNDEQLNLALYPSGGIRA